MTPEESLRALDVKNAKYTPYKRTLWEQIHGAIRGNWAWLRQGMPRDEPAVSRRGIFQMCPHGHCLLDGWGFFTAYQRTPITANELVDRYKTRYQPEPVPSLDSCHECAEAIRG